MAPSGVKASETKRQAAKKSFLGGKASIAQTNVIVPLGRQTAATSLALNMFVQLSLMQFSLACFTTQANDTSIEPQAVFRRGSVWKSVCTHCLCTLLQLPKCRGGWWGVQSRTLSRKRDTSPLHGKCILIRSLTTSSPAIPRQEPSSVSARPSPDPIVRGDSHTVLHVQIKFQNMGLTVRTNNELMILLPTNNDLYEKQSKGF